MKYKLLQNDKIEFKGRTLYRIQAIKEVGPIKEGEIGGYVENENILSQEGECWIGGDSKVFGNSKIFDKAKIYDEAIVRDSKISGNSVIAKNAFVENSTIKGFDVLDRAYLNFCHLDGSGVILDDAKLQKVNFCGSHLVIGLNAEICSVTDLRFVTIGRTSISFCKDRVLGISVGLPDWDIMPIDEFIERVKKCGEYSSLYQYKEEAIAYAQIAKKFLTI